MFLTLNLLGDAIAALILEVRVCLALQTDIAPVRKIAHKADQGRAALPHVAALPPQNARHGIEVPIKGMAGAITIDYNFSATS